MKKENQALKEKNGFAERDLVLLQEEYDSIKGKLEKCAMANEKLLESNNSLKVRKKIKMILMAAAIGYPLSIFRKIWDWKTF